MDSYRKPKSTTQTNGEVNNNKPQNNGEVNKPARNEVENAKNIRNGNNNSNTYTTSNKNNDIQNSSSNNINSNNSYDGIISKNRSSGNGNQKGANETSNPCTKNEKDTFIRKNGGNGGIGVNGNVTVGTPQKPAAEGAINGIEVSDKPSVEVNSESKIAKLLPSAETVVSSTTSTATQPLKIQTDLELLTNMKDSADSIHLPDASDLRPTSVSNAMNRMNNTVLDSKTLMRESNISSRLSPAAIGSVNNEDAKGDAPTSAKINSNNTKPSVITENGGNKTLIKIPDNFSVNNKTNGNSVKSSSGEQSLGLGTPVISGSTHQSANGRIREARTIVATDVKPIKITVREKPQDFDVQSGNVRIPVVANGIDDRPR